MLVASKQTQHYDITRDPPQGYKGVELQQWSLLVSEDVFLLKPLGDPRLYKALNISEFIKAFIIHKNILCASFPE